jgi:hypothetical protein
MAPFQQVAWEAQYLVSPWLTVVHSVASELDLATVYLDREAQAIQSQKLSAPVK